MAYATTEQRVPQCEIEPYPAPVAYTYEADTHCAACAYDRFGRDRDGGDIGIRPDGEPCEDDEGNPVGVIAPWDSDAMADGLTCGTCGGLIVEPPAR